MRHAGCSGLTREQPKNNNSTHISPSPTLINPSKSRSQAAYKNPHEIYQFMNLPMNLKFYLKVQRFWVRCVLFFAVAMFKLSGGDTGESA
jgi:hypothetical protein